MDQFEVDEFSDDGTTRRSRRFGRDDFPSAADHFNRRVALTLEPDARSAFEIGLEVVAAVARFDYTALEASLSEDFVQIDHRPIGYPPLSRAGLVEATAAQSDIVQIWLTMTVHAATTRGWVNTGSFWTDEPGHWSGFEFGIYVVTTDGTLITRMEIFPESRLTDALSRFDELTT